MRARLVVLVSGSGTNLQALLDAEQEAYEVVGVVSDRPDAAALARAAAAGVVTTVVDPANFPTRVAWDEALAEAVVGLRPDWIVCAGFMRILGSPTLDAFPDRVINTHPALLPAFPGAHGVRDALAYGVRVTGCTVHLVDSGVDTGPILAQAPVEIRDGDDESTVHERIKVVERGLLVAMVIRLCREGCTVVDRKVTIP